MNVEPDAQRSQKHAPTKAVSKGKAPALIRNDSYSDRPFVENVEDTPTPRAKATTSVDSGLPFVQNLEDTPTPRARYLIPKPLSDIGRPRRKAERHDSSSSPSAAKYPDARNILRQKPPIYLQPRGQPKRYMMSGALHPADMATRRPFSPDRCVSPLSLFEGQASVIKVEPSQDLSKRSMTSPASSSQSSVLRLRQSVEDDLPTRPVNTEGNNTLPHHRPSSHFSEPRHNNSQHGKSGSYSASEYSENSADMDSIDDDRRGESREYLQFEENAVTEEELALRRGTSEVDEGENERELRKRKASFDDWKLSREAYFLGCDPNGGRTSSLSFQTITEQKFIARNNWDVEEDGPVPKQTTREEHRMDIDTAFLIEGKRIVPAWRRDVEPYVQQILATREPKSEATLEREFEEFKAHVEDCRRWHETVEDRMKTRDPVRDRWLAERKKEQAEYEALSEEEKIAWRDRKSQEKLERLCKEADERKAARKSNRWLRRKKEEGSGQKSKSGDSEESKTEGGVNGTRGGGGGGGDGGKVTAFKRFIRGGIRKRS